MTVRADDQIEIDVAAAAAAGARKQGLLIRVARNQSVIIGAVIVVLMMLIGLAAPLLGTVDPKAINPTVRNLKPGVERSMMEPPITTLGCRSSLIQMLGRATAAARAAAASTSLSSAIVNSGSSDRRSCRRCRSPG